MGRKAIGVLNFKYPRPPSNLINLVTGIIYIQIKLEKVKDADTKIPSNREKPTSTLVYNFVSYNLCANLEKPSCIQKFHQNFPNNHFYL